MNMIRIDFHRIVRVAVNDPMISSYIQELSGLIQNDPRIKNWMSGGKSDAGISFQQFKDFAEEVDGTLVFSNRWGTVVFSPTPDGKVHMAWDFKASQNKGEHIFPNVKEAAEESVAGIWNALIRGVMM